MKKLIVLISLIVLIVVGTFYTKRITEAPEKTEYIPTSETYVSWGDGFEAAYVKAWRGVLPEVENALPIDEMKPLENGLLFRGNRYTCYSPDLLFLNTDGTASCWTFDLRMFQPIAATSSGKWICTMNDDQQPQILLICDGNDPNEIGCYVLEDSLILDITAYMENDFSAHIYNASAGSPSLDRIPQEAFREVWRMHTDGSMQEGGYLFIEETLVYHSHLLEFTSLEYPALTYQLRYATVQLRYATVDPGSLWTKELLVMEDYSSNYPYSIDVPEHWAGSELEILIAPKFEKAYLL